MRHNILEKTGNIFQYMISRERKSLLIFVMVGILLRSITVIIAYTKTGVIPSLYLIWGEKIADNGYVQPIMEMEQMIIAPFLPSLIALFRTLLGNPIIPFIVYNISVSVLMIPVVFYLGKEMFSTKTGWLAALWCLCNPEFFRYNASILKEPTLFLLIPLTLLLLIYWTNNKGKYKYFILSAFAFTLLIHTDERFIFFLSVFPLLFLYRKSYAILSNLKHLLFWIGFVALLSSPWLVRNYLVYDQVVIISTRTTAITSNVWGKNLTNLEYSDTQKSLERNREKYSKLSDEFERNYGVAPQKYLGRQVYIKGFVNYWQPAYFSPTYITYGYRPQRWSLAHNLTSILFYGIFLPFYLAGLILLIRRKRMKGIILGLIPLIHCLLHVYLVSPLERYRYPIVFIVVIIGIWFGDFCLRFARQKI